MKYYARGALPEETSIYTAENLPILNQVYDILEEFHNQRKQIILCKVPAHIRIKENEEADKVAKRGQTV